MNFPVDIPFADLLGLELVHFAQGEAEVTWGARDDCTNSFGSAHGGVLMTLLDIAMLHAARSPAAGADEPGPRCATVDMKTAFLRPGRGPLRARGNVLMRSGSLAFCEGSVMDEGGQLVARASATFKTIRTD
jgi:uncharacterized protein (TIGR00369 family)